MSEINTHSLFIVCSVGHYANILETTLRSLLVAPVARGWLLLYRALYA